MKYLKIFEQNSEKWTFNKIDDLYNDKSDMASLILRYLVFNNLVELKKDRFAYHYNIDEFWFEEDDDDGFFSVTYKERNPHEIRYDFTKQQFDDLLSFMNDPETYESAKKYNI
jgi:hypothetical protein